MKPVVPVSNIALVDDGELEEVARVLEAGGLAFDRFRGGQIPERIAEPRELLIVTARRVEHMAAPRKRDASSPEPLRIVAVEEDSPALRRRLRRRGMQILVRLPARRETWRLLIARALWQGDERRFDARVSPDIAVTAGSDETTLVDLSNRGCRIQTRAELSVGDPIRFSIPGEAMPGGAREPLALAGRIRRVAQLSGAARRTYAIVFDADLPTKTRERLTAAINQWAAGSGPTTMRAAVNGPPIPACRLPSLPDLMLDDETDPPIPADGPVAIELAEDERRRRPRGQFASVVRAERGERRIALVGRDLSAGGMRIDRHPDLALGDRFRIALHGPTLAQPLRVDAAIVRDDGDGGLALAFIGVSRETSAALEKLVACLPDVESLADGELAGLGTVLSEIVPD